MSLPKLRKFKCTSGKLRDPTLLESARFFLLENRIAFSRASIEGPPVLSKEMIHKTNFLVLKDS